MSNRDTVLGLLPKLSKVDLAVVKAATEQLLGPARTEHDEWRWLFDTIKVQLVSGINYPSFQKQGSAYSKAFHEHAPAVVQFVEDTFPNAKQISRIAMVRFLVSVLIDDLRQRGATVTLGTVISNLGRLPEMFDKSFPSYRQSGLAHLILRAMEKRDAYSKRGQRKGG